MPKAIMERASSELADPLLIPPSNTELSSPIKPNSDLMFMCETYTHADERPNYENKYSSVDALCLDIQMKINQTFKPF